MIDVIVNHLMGLRVYQNKTVPTISLTPLRYVYGKRVKSTVLKKNEKGLSVVRSVVKQRMIKERHETS